jgi:hypothetical protein
MLLFVLRAALSGVMIAAIAAIARRSPGFGALVASLPLVSVLAALWLWHDTHDAARLEAYVGSTFWYVLPSLPMFLIIPALMRSGLGFYAAMGIGCCVTVLLYLGMTWARARIV